MILWKNRPKCSPSRCCQNEYITFTEHLGCILQYFFIISTLITLMCSCEQPHFWSIMSGTNCSDRIYYVVRVPLIGPFHKQDSFIESAPEYHRGRSQASNLGKKKNRFSVKKTKKKQFRQT
jgi:hypothetical protein